ncbi:MAG: T9SS type A sorting domain-containing protein [Carboxylicivirga sp.]|jgi:hypothetical protein|nr:T9SS type A sorting domain-containing protein [Carboxylicivirga sp.]
MTTKILSFLAFAFISVLVSAQDQQLINPNDLPDVADYIIERNNVGADTVIIGLHGGPTSSPFSGNFDWFGISNPGISVVEMKKHHHMLDPNDVYFNKDLTIEDAIVHNDTTVAMVHKLVKHFNDQNKKVVLMGHSFGAFVVAEYMDDYGTDDLYKIIPMSARLNMNPEVVEGFKNGIFATFINGIDVQMGSQPQPEDWWGRMKLMAGLGYNRYVDSLQNVNMSNVMYVYATHDAAVGRLLPEEIELLENNGARVEEIGGGSHQSAFDQIRLKNVLAFIRPQVSTGTDEFEADQVKMYPTVITNVLTIESTLAGTITIHDMSGKVQLVKEVESGVNRIEVGALQAGIYIASYQGLDNEVIRKKIIKRSN